MSDQIEALFAAIEAQQRKEEDEAKQIARHIGDNGGPPLEKLFGIRAPWFRFADADDSRRLAKLQLRIDRKRQNLKEMTKERATIMQRCIRRMRRAEGKE